MMHRRQLLGALVAAAVGGAGSPASDDAPIRKATVTPLFKSPDGHPNALETAGDGMWIGEQTTDRAYLVDRKGRVRRRVETESSNSSGIAFGGGFLWMAANGKALGRPPRPADATSGEIVKVQPATGKTVARFPVPGGGGVHGLEYAGGLLWITSLRLRKLSAVDPGDFRLVRQIPVHLDRAHGLAWDPPAIWVMHSTGRVIHKLDAETGRLLEVIALSAGDPDPHGMCLLGGRLYYCDAGIGPGGKSNESRWAGYICRVDPAHSP